MPIAVKAAPVKPVREHGLERLRTEPPVAVGDLDGGGERPDVQQCEQAQQREQPEHCPSIARASPEPRPSIKA